MFLKFCVLIGSVAFASSRPLFKELIRSSSVSAARGLILDNTKLLEDGLKFAKDLVEYGHWVASNGTAGATYSAHVAIENAANFAIRALSGGNKIYQEALDLLEPLFDRWRSESKVFNSIDKLVLRLENFIRIIVEQSAYFAHNADVKLFQINRIVQRRASQLRLAALSAIKTGEAFVSAVGTVQDIKKTYDRLIDGLFKGKYEDIPLVKSAIHRFGAKTIMTNKLPGGTMPHGPSTDASFHAEDGEITEKPVEAKISVNNDVRNSSRILPENKIYFAANREPSSFSSTVVSTTDAAHQTNTPQVANEPHTSDAPQTVYPADRSLGSTLNLIDRVENSVEPSLNKDYIE